MVSRVARSFLGKVQTRHPVDLKKFLPRREKPQPRAILIVDDAQERRRTVRCVEQLGYRALQAGNAESALDAIAGEEPACVLLSLDVEGGKGLQALAEVRAERPNVDVIMLAPTLRDSRTVEALRLGAVTYLAKPVGQEDLREVLAGR